MDTVTNEAIEAKAINPTKDAPDLRPATKEDIARLEAKIDHMTRVFEELGTTFETQIKSFLDGPMGKMFGKLAGNGRSNTSA